MDSTHENADFSNYYLGKNAAQLLLAISRDALAGLDLGGTNLSGVVFWEADLRATDLTDAVLRNSILVSAKFYERDITSAKLEDTVISFYLNETEVTSSYSDGELLRLVAERLTHI